jgi:hypothetical protein
MISFIGNRYSVACIYILVFESGNGFVVVKIRPEKYLKIEITFVF